MKGFFSFDAQNGDFPQLLCYSARGRGFGEIFREFLRENIPQGLLRTLSQGLP